MAMYFKLLAALAAATLAGCFGPGAEPGGAPAPDAHRPADAGDAGTPAAEPYVVLAEKLRAPWAIAFDGETIYVSEREGSVVRVEPDGTATRKPVRLQAGVAASGESGFLGFALAPNFAETKAAYAYHTYEANGAMRNRVVLLEERETEWVELRPLLEGIPGSRIHDGGRIAIGPDGHVYVTTGDAGEEAYAQDRSSLAGKILRLAPDGSVPEDNPFPGSYVYSYGHRNPQGLAWSADGAMYAAEHGPSGRPGGHDEINAIEAGGNYGWPKVYGDENEPGLIAPLYHSGEPPAIAPSGAAMGEDGRLLLATLRGETLFRFDPAALERLEPLLEGEGRLRDVAAKGGFAYVLTNNTDGRGTPGPSDDRLLKVRLP
ncbi:PQQ-dependent sugar dehydrogenase [Paenibacillus sp.]|uniref:PQQ-dependent sugar dehydrogenase n=1 Tax=Paenibacillus sp. TaxID=58172 RepID=UPI002D43BC30|nr:PQQ-dependent sugar dehydrogenase [Paenibacillus sp.]HZG58183.1 PQQ-dependent sugar dehydrogenase [Paenibacillus sp.]